MPWVCHCVAQRCPLHDGSDMARLPSARVWCCATRDRLAVQLPDRVYIYELAHDDAYDMHYRIKDKIYEHLECNLLVRCRLHLPSASTLHPYARC